MDKNTVKGALKEGVGKVQQKIGEATGSDGNVVKGHAKQAEGNLQQAYGNAKDAVKKAIK